MSAGARPIATGGVNLHAVVEGDGPPVVILHGFTGSTASMAGAAIGLRERYRVIRIDGWAGNRGGTETQLYGCGIN